MSNRIGKVGHETEVSTSSNFHYIIPTDSSKRIAELDGEVFEKVVTIWESCQWIHIFSLKTTFLQLKRRIKNIISPKPLLNIERQLCNSEICGIRNQSGVLRIMTTCRLVVLVLLFYL